MYFQGHRMKNVSFTINLRYFLILRASASVAVVPGCIKSLDSGDWVQESTTVTSNTSCLPIPQGIKVTPSGRLPSVRYILAVRALKASREIPTSDYERIESSMTSTLGARKTFSFNSFTTVHVCTKQMLAPRRKPIEIRDTRQFTEKIFCRKLTQGQYAEKFSAKCLSRSSNWVSANCLSANCPVSGFCSCEAFKID